MDRTIDGTRFLVDTDGGETFFSSSSHFSNKERLA